MIGLREGGKSTLARLLANPMPHAARRALLTAAYGFVNVAGTMLFTKPPPGEARLLNLGCGATSYDGFVNADIYGALLIWRRRFDWMLDAARPWPCPDGYWSGIFCEHALEHLYYREAVVCVREAYRTLRPGGVLRLIVPDADHYVEFYRNGGPGSPFASGPEALSNLTQNFAHHSVWNAALLCELLSETGFTDVLTERFGSGSMPELLRDTPDRAWESCYVEGRKP